MRSNNLCLFESRDSEAETIPDEDYSILSEKKKINSWHVGTSNYPRLAEGPNINLKYFKKHMILKKKKILLQEK